jgi:hypothetical protein
MCDEVGNETVKDKLVVSNIPGILMQCTTRMERLQYNRRPSGTIKYRPQGRTLGDLKKCGRISSKT